MRIERIEVAAPGVVDLLRQSDDCMTALYPPESNHLESADELARPDVALFGCFIDDRLVGCVATRPMEDDGRYGEIKRLFVTESCRGRGVSSALMAAAERHLGDAGITIVRAETGVRQPAALGLYARLGYVERPPFGAYVADPLSVFLEKRLDVP